MFFTVGAWLGDWCWKGQRAVFLIVELAAVFGLVLLLRGQGLADGWVFVYAWNPLVLKEVANSAHLDVLVLFWLTALLLAMIRLQRGGRTVAWAVAAGFCLGMAVLSKLYPLILLPVVLAPMLKRRRVSALVLTTTLALTVVGGYLPFVDAGRTGLTAGLGAYAGSWNMNQGAFALIDSLLESRLLALIVVGLLAALVPLLLRGERTGALITRIFASLAIWFLLLPAPFPWYAIPLVGLASLVPWSRMASWAVVLSGLLGLYYLSFLFEYRGLDPQWWTATRVVEHGLIWTALLALVAVGARADSPPKAGRSAVPRNS